MTHPSKLPSKAVRVYPELIRVSGNLVGAYYFKVVVGCVHQDQKSLWEYEVRFIPKAIKYYVSEVSGVKPISNSPELNEISRLTDTYLARVGIKADKIQPGEKVLRFIKALMEQAIIIDENNPRLLEIQRMCKVIFVDKASAIATNKKNDGFNFSYTGAGMFFIHYKGPVADDEQAKYFQPKK